jgi:hypothetical protein
MMQAERKLSLITLLRRPVQYLSSVGLLIAATLASAQRLQEPVSIADLRMRVDMEFSRSVYQCATYQPGDISCIKKQFVANYEYYINGGRERDWSSPEPVGPPGTPGAKQ